MLVPQYDSLHVISDIHLGGIQKFQIFNQQDALSWFIDNLAGQPETQKIALVLNGDIVDFLAEPAPNNETECYFRPSHAMDDLKRIMGDPSFVKVWKALSNFIQTPNRYLILVLGNHDVELALSEIREFLMDRLCGTSDAARGRLTFAMDGTGFACQVEEKNILCIHGNETDAWNPVDYRTLARINAEKKRHTAIPPWIPNAGTKMVVDVMNEMKKKYRWIDLLKPETETIPALLLAMDNKAITWSRIKKLAGVAADFVRDKQRGPDNFLGLEGNFSDEEASEELAFHKMITTGYPSLTKASSPDATDMDSLLNEMDVHVANGIVPTRLADDAEMAKDTGSNRLADNADQVEFLGAWGAVWDKIRRRSPEENMREALQGWLKNDPTFDPKKEDDTCKKARGLVGPEVDVVIAGHTHLHKAIEPSNNTAYFNTGSWIRLMQFTPDLLEKEAFKEVWATLKKGDMKSLDAATVNGHPLIRHIRSVVSIEKEPDGTVRGTLATVEKNDATYKMNPVPKGTFKC